MERTAVTEPMENPETPDGTVPTVNPALTENEAPPDQPENRDQPDPKAPLVILPTYQPPGRNQSQGQ